MRKRERILRYMDELIDLRERVEKLRNERMRTLRDGRRECDEAEEVVIESRNADEISHMRREDKESRYAQELRTIKELEFRSKKRMEKDKSTFLPLNSSLRRLVEEKTSKLRTQRRKRVLELFELYPITKAEENYYIRGKSFSRKQSRDGVKMELQRREGAAALGHCAKLAITLAEYMNVTLYHEIRFFGSESCVFDREHKKNTLSPSSSASFSKAVDLLDDTTRRLASNVLSGLGVDIKILSIAFPERVSSSSRRYSRSILESMYAIQSYCMFDDGKSWRKFLSTMDKRNRSTTSPVQFQRGDGEWDIVHWK